MFLDVRLLYDDLNKFYRDDIDARHLFNLSVIEIVALCLMDTDGYLLCDSNELYGRFIESYLNTPYNEIAPLVDEVGNMALCAEEVYFRPNESDVIISITNHLAAFCESHFPTGQFDWYIRTRLHHPLTYILEMETIDETNGTYR